MAEDGHDDGVVEVHDTLGCVLANGARRRIGGVVSAVPARRCR